ncbi:MAG: 3'-5' exonuclease [Clostridiales bacterium]|nr:3'-5' exonuclease [Clostridiales bacterium]
MILYQLFTHPPDEQELKNLKAYRDKNTGIWYITPYFAMEKFSRWQIIGQTQLSTYSFSIMCRLVCVNQKAAQRFMENCGYLERGSLTPTNAAKALGVFMMTGQNQKGETYTYWVYQDNFAQFLAQNRAVIEQFLGESQQKKVEEKQIRESLPKTEERIAAFQNAGYSITCFKKTGIPDMAVVIQVETTGLGNSDEVVELAISDLGGNLLYNQTFRPYQRVSDGARAVNSISDAELAAAPDFSSEFNRILSVLNGRPVIGHNILFVKRMLEQTAAAHLGAGAVNAVTQAFCMMIDSREVSLEYIHVRSNSLEPLCEMLGMKQPGAHRAADGCRKIIWVLTALETRPFQNLNSKAA